ncbi:hypothetical protein SAY86_028133 [Trapa natans]|uniref:GIL1/IRKI C-terminal domain-containing protein n=1 Tax=Trapa natans TaxID=22666 RepID=A0AAN7M0H7_TRANT|nr:hypothetical protein SAY86_028133 [Trapa natans]
MENVHLPSSRMNKRQKAQEPPQIKIVSSLKSSPFRSFHFSPKVEECDGRKSGIGFRGGDKRVSGKDQRKGEVASVFCDGCRPQYGRESKISVVPVEYDAREPSKRGVPISFPSPNGMLKTIVSSLLRMSPMMGGGKNGRVSRPAVEADDYWKAALGELSCKLIETTRERDGALMEVSKLKYSMVELEKKLNRLEVYCHGLKSGIEERCRIKSPVNSTDDKMIVCLSAALSKVHRWIMTLSRLLVLELGSTGPFKVNEMISELLMPYDMEVSPSTDPTRLTLYLEAILSDTFFEDFESVGFQKNAASSILNPSELCEANLASYHALKRTMTWQGVLEKGTRHFSDGFRRYCDQKMIEIVGKLGWSRAWSEPVLEAFFGASKGAWLVHLLANSVHPGLPIFRVDRGTPFDPVYMQDLGKQEAEGEAIASAGAVVWFMVMPGFHVLDGVVKCKVVCRC